jgi:hypothetical protein
MTHVTDTGWMNSFSVDPLDDVYLFLLGYLKPQVYELQILVRDHLT